MDVILFVATTVLGTILYKRKETFIMGNLISSSSSNNETTVSHLLQCAINGDLDKIKSIVQQNNDNVQEILNGQDAAGNAAIHGAVFAGHIHIVQYLINNGASYIIQNGIGCTPIWLASGYNRINILEYLIEKLNIEDIYQTNNTNDTPLLAAASKGYIEICNKLLKVGSSSNEVKTKMITMANKNNDTPLSAFIASSCIDQELLKELIDSSIINLRNSKGLTPLLLSCEQDQVEYVQTLILSGASIDITDATDNSIISVAAFCGSQNVLKYLLEEQVYSSNLLNRVSCQTGCTPLWLAVRAGHLDCVKILLSHPQIDVTIANKEGLTPIQIAEKYNRQSIVYVMKEKK